METRIDGQSTSEQTAELERRREKTQFLRALQDMRDGTFGVRLPGDWTGVSGTIADTFNEIVAANAQVASYADQPTTRRTCGYYLGEALISQCAISKPADTERLLALLRMWVRR